MTIIELRDALKKATGPDRALDCRIEILLGDGKRINPDVASDDVVQTLLSPRAFGIGGLAEPVGEADDVWQYLPRTNADYFGLPSYTASIDAAVSLVPEGFEYALTNLYHLASFECPLNGSDNDLPLCLRRKDDNIVLAICQWRIEYEIAKAAREE